MLWTESLYGLIIVLSLAIVRLSVPPTIDEIPQLELLVLPGVNYEYYKIDFNLPSHKKTYQTK